MIGSLVINPNLPPNVLTDVPQIQARLSRVQLFLGFAQMAFLAMTFGAWIAVGLGRTTLVLAAIATALALLSRFIFRDRRGKATGKEAEFMKDVCLSSSL